MVIAQRKIMYVLSLVLLLLGCSMSYPSVEALSVQLIDLEPPPDIGSTYQMQEDRIYATFGLDNILYWYNLSQGSYTIQTIPKEWGALHFVFSDRLLFNNRIEGTAYLTDLDGMYLSSLYCKNAKQFATVDPFPYWEVMPDLSGTLFTDSEEGIAYYCSCNKEEMSQILPSTYVCSQPIIISTSDVLYRSTMREDMDVYNDWLNATNRDSLPIMEEPHVEYWLFSLMNQTVERVEYPADAYFMGEYSQDYLYFSSGYYSVRERKFISFVDSVSTPYVIQKEKRYNFEMDKGQVYLNIYNLLTEEKQQVPVPLSSEVCELRPIGMTSNEELIICYKEEPTTPLLWKRVCILNSNS